MAPGLGANPIDLGSLRSGEVALWAARRNGFARERAGTDSNAGELGKPRLRLSRFCFD